MTIYTGGVPLSSEQLAQFQADLAQGDGLSAAVLVGEAKARLDGIGGRILLPSASTWDSARYPLNIYRTGRGNYSTDLDPKSLISSGVWNGRVAYASRTRGNGSYSGATPAQAKATILQAAALIEADSSVSGGIVLVEAGGIYDRTCDFNGTGSGGRTFTKPIAVIGWGDGPVYNGPTQILTWASVNAEVPGAYKTQTTRSGVVGVLDLLNTTPEGAFKELTKQSSAANVSSNLGWYTDNSDTWVKRPDGLPVTNDNTIVLLAAASIDIGSFDTYVSGFHALGGASGTLRATVQSVTRNLVAENCVFQSPTSASGPSGSERVISIDYMDGIAAFFRCTGHLGKSDNANIHRTSGSGVPHLLLADCNMYRAGQNKNENSCNLLTGHEITPVLTIGGEFMHSAGRAAAFIGDSELCAFGSKFGYDVGDYPASGGVSPSGAFGVGDRARMWLHETQVEGCAYAYYIDPTSTTAEINTWNCDAGGGLSSIAGGGVKQFTPRFA